jgi:hypothetical protein
MKGVKDRNKKSIASTEELKHSTPVFLTLRSIEQE